MGSILDLYGRKRERIAEDSEEGEGRVTRRRRNSSTAQLRPTERNKEEEGESSQENMNIGKLKDMADVRKMIIAENMNKQSDALKNEKNEIRNEVKQLRQTIEKEREVDRERIVELDKKIESKAEVWERKIEEIKND